MEKEMLKYIGLPIGQFEKQQKSSPTSKIYPLLAYYFV